MPTGGPEQSCPLADPCTGQEWFGSSHPMFSAWLGARQRGHDLSIHPAMDPKGMAAEGYWQLQASQRVLSQRNRGAAHCHGCHGPPHMLHRSTSLQLERATPQFLWVSEEKLQRKNEQDKLCPITATPHLHPPAETRG